MQWYFYDLSFTLDVIKQESLQVSSLMVLEPDLLGYMSQNAPAAADGEVDPLTVPASLKAALAAKPVTELKDVAVQDNLVGWVECVSLLIKRRASNVKFTFQVNLWAGTDARHWMKGTERGICNAVNDVGLDTGVAIVKEYARRTALFMQRCGVNKYTDLIAFDKYGYDGALVEASAAANPETSRWFFNHDAWMSYIMYVTEISKALGCKSVLWQQTCGYLNDSQDISPYTQMPYPKLTDLAPSGEDGCPCFVFGSTFVRPSDKTATYFSKDLFNAGVTTSGTKITWPRMADKLFAQNIAYYLAGAGVGGSTTNLPMSSSGYKVTDNYYGISKYQLEYLSRYRP
jgi:hypothetical protein